VVVGNQAISVSQTFEGVVPKDGAIALLQGKELSLGMSDDEVVLNDQIGQPPTLEVGLPDHDSRSLN